MEALKTAVAVAACIALTVSAVFIEEALREQWGEWRERRNLAKDIKAWENLAHTDRRRIAP